MPKENSYERNETMWFSIFLDNALQFDILKSANYFKTIRILFPNFASFDIAIWSIVLNRVKNGIFRPIWEWFGIKALAVDFCFKRGH